MAEDTRIPLRNRETTAIQFLLGLAQEANDAVKTLGARLESVGQKERLKTVADDVADVATKVLTTVPVEKLPTLKKNLSCMQMEIHTKRVSQRQDDEFTYVPTLALRALCAEAAKERCELCIGFCEDAEHCKFRKVLKQVLMIDIEPDVYGCEYKRLDWSDT